MANETIVYEGLNAPSLDVLTDGETVWLTQAQMCQLFGRERSVITKHIRNAFQEGEVSEKSNVQNMHIAKQGTLFRRWATRCLKEIMLRRMAVDHRLATMECRLAEVEDGLAQLAEAIATPEPFYAEDREMIGFKPKAKKNVEENRK